jgi:hypothetical protein
MRVHYLKGAEWEQDWVDNAIEVAEDCWRKHYKAAAPEQAGSTQTGTSGTQFGYSKVRPAC